MSGITMGQYLPLNTIIHRTNPTIKLLGMLGLVFLVLMAKTFFAYSVIFIFVAVFTKLSGMGFKASLTSIFRLWQFFAFILLMNGLFSKSGQPLWTWWIFSISAKGIINGVNVVLRICFLMLLSGILSSTTTPKDLTSAIGNIISPLKLLFVPTQDVAMILGIALQFVPMLAQEAKMIETAQRARGANFQSGNLKERARAMLPLVVPIFISAFRRADCLSTAMEARGYCGGKGRTKIGGKIK